MNPEPETQNPKLKTRNSKLETQNFRTSATPQLSPVSGLLTLDIRLKKVRIESELKGILTMLYGKN